MYFTAPKDYFWKWAENTEVIEWREGNTICYRDELIYLLKEFTGTGFPPLETILLVLAACNKGIPFIGRFSLNKQLNKFNDPELEQICSNALKFLEMLHQLPAELRTGESRIHLLNELFKKNDFVLSNTVLNEGLENLRSGRLDSLIIKEGNEITSEKLRNHLQYLSNGLKRFSTKEELETYLRTGLTSIPEAAPVEIPQPSHGDLFTELEQDQETLGIARLARRISSVISIPMHSQGSGDRSHGGLSDITNRGNYDRLLLSELAHDDMVLMSRLVNNEALYFRREEPPDNPKRKRTILLDSTLKMWGVPRVFALSSALAFAHNSKHGETVEAYVLGGEEYERAELQTKQGIVASLEKMHHALHCGTALNALLKELPGDDLNEYTLITEADQLRSPGFHESLNKARENLGFIITVNRTGELHFYECTLGKLKLLNTARLDLGELLFSPAGLPVKKRELNKDEPVFLGYAPSPLLCAKVRIAENPERIFELTGKGYFVVNENQRGLFIESRNKGALEVLNHIEKGKFFFGWNETDTVFILVINFQRKIIKAYSANIHTGEHAKVNLDETIYDAKDGKFVDNKFYVRTDIAAYEFDCASMTITNTQNWKGYAEIFNRVTYLPAFPKWINSNGYNVMYKIRKMYIDEEGILNIGNYSLIVRPSGDIWVQEKLENKEAVCSAEETNDRQQYIGNRGVKFIERTWPDGSRAILDSRGFMHLISIDPSIPQITVLLVTGEKIACWTPDRTVCGSEYFINNTVSPTIISATSFYEKYIKAYLTTIMKGCK